MSIYRNHNAPTSDVHATPVGKDNPADPANKRADWQYQAPTAPVAAPVPTTLLALRKPEQPANILLKHTIQWAEKLPENVRPLSLMREYPRVANMIALLWNEPTRVSFDQYMEALLVDRRGNRQGFPPAVANDLMTLRTAFDERYRLR